MIGSCTCHHFHVSVPWHRTAFEGEGITFINCSPVGMVKSILSFTGIGFAIIVSQFTVFQTIHDDVCIGTKTTYTIGCDQLTIPKNHLKILNIYFELLSGQGPESGR